MSDQPALPITAAFTPFNPDDHRTELADAIHEIESTGVRVTGAHFAAQESPPRFFIQFISDEPQWQVRLKLEAKMYDVGSKIGSNQLTFYVTKRTQLADGWST